MTAYDNSIPAANDDPSVSQGEIQQNFASIQLLVDKNHVDFGDANYGKHKYTSLVKQSAVPTGIVDECNLYSKVVSGATEQFFTPDATKNEYQITSSDSSRFARFATNDENDPNNFTGWTFLPGGLILNYGSKKLSGSSGSIVFAKPFSATPFSCTTGLERDDAPDNGAAGNVIVTGSLSTTGFNYATGSGGSKYLYFIAIGLA